MDHISFQDVNDEVPSFTSLQYTATVSEAALVGTSILHVSAEDADSGINSLITYHLEAVSYASNDSAYFHIDSEKGTVSVKHPLDYERRSEMIFCAVATDSGLPKLRSKVLLKVIILDFNDNAPLFTQPHYEISISDRVVQGQVITSVRAYDLDDNLSTTITYSLLAKTSDTLFNINTYTGIVSLSSIRTPELVENSYSLNISVTDGVFTSFTYLHINVVHTNDHVPTFSHTIIDVDVSENQDIGHFVSQLTAIDEDRGLFGHVTYHIQSEDAREIFELDSESGRQKF